MKYRVKLASNPERIVEADDDFGAIEAYKKLLGILRSAHTFAVEPAEELPAAEPAPAEAPPNVEAQPTEPATPTAAAVEVASAAAVVEMSPNEMELTDLGLPASIVKTLAGRGLGTVGEVRRYARDHNGLGALLSREAEGEVVAAIKALLKK